MIEYDDNESYKAELKEIRYFFGDRCVLSVSDVSNYTGRSRKWVRTHLGVSGREGVTATNLAIKLTEMNRRAHNHSKELMKK